MSIIISSFVTLACDSCDKTVTFPQTEEGEKEARATHPWINSTIRSVQTADGRKFSYCSDECEANSVGQGNHNIKQIIPAPSGPNTVALAAEAAARAAAATEALKTGQGKVVLG